MPVSQLFYRRQKFSAQVFIANAAAIGFCVDDHIKPAWNLTERFAKYLPKQTLNPIPYNRSPDFAGRSYSQPAMLQGIAAAEQYKIRRMNFTTGFIERLVVRGTNDTDGTREIFSGRDNRVSHSP